MNAAENVNGRPLPPYVNCGNVVDDTVYVVVGMKDENEIEIVFWKHAKILKHVRMLDIDAGETHWNFHRYVGDSQDHPENLKYMVQWEYFSDSRMIVIHCIEDRFSIDDIFSDVMTIAGQASRPIYEDLTF